MARHYSCAIISKHVQKLSNGSELCPTEFKTKPGEIVIKLPLKINIDLEVLMEPVAALSLVSV